MSTSDRKVPNFALAFALATGAKQRVAAAQFGISERTIRRKLSQPGFRRTLARIRHQLISQVLGRLTDGLDTAIDTLTASLTDKDPAIRIRAARTLLLQADRYRASIDIGERINDLEAELKNKQQGNS